MIGFIAENIGSIIAGAAVIAVLAAACAKLIKDRKAGKSSCSCGCGGCPNSSVCHGEKK